MFHLPRIRQGFANKLSRCYLYAAEVTVLMHCCSLLVIASSMDNETLKRIDLPHCKVFLAPSTIPGTGFGVFAGSAYKKHELLPSPWKTLLLPENFPKSEVLRNYVFGYNDTHMALTLDYASVINHHDSANVHAVRSEFPPGNYLQFQVLKDIEAGQEVLVRYNSAQWFEAKKIPYSDVDYANTMWRPDLQPLPCRENVSLTFGEDGRTIFAAPTMLPSGTVMDVSLCVKVSLIIVDQFVLWDFVLMDETTQMVCVPLSYAAQIQSTPDPELANVRVSLFNMDHNVTGSANIMVSVTTIQELRAGDILLRYKAKAIEDDISVFSAQSRDELTRAVYDCCRDEISSGDNDLSRLHGPIGNWDVSQVTDMTKVFRNFIMFDYTLSNWDVSRVTDMTAIFDGALSFNQDLSNWDVSNVTDMTAMFHFAKVFNQELSNWDVSRVTKMTVMFHNAISFNQDLSNWDVSCVTDMGAMFGVAISFNQDLSNWNVSRVTDMGAMFRHATAFNQDLSDWDVSRVAYMRVMFANAESFNHNLSKWDLSCVTDMGAMFRHATSFSQDLSDWDVSRITYMGALFRHARSFNSNLSNWDVSRVTDMKRMFGVATCFDQDLSNWDVSRVTDMYAMFRNATSFNQDLSEWDVSRVTDMKMMFFNATSFNQDLSDWDVSRVVNMEAMFANARSFQQTLCGAAWVNSNASKVDMFTYSLGSISGAVCAFSPQSRDELKRAVDDCGQLPEADRVSKKKRLDRF